MAHYKRLRNIREDSDMTQAQVADLLFVNRRTYSSYENCVNMIPLDILSQLADLYNTSVDYLMERTDVKTPYAKPKKSGASVKYVDVTGLTDEEIDHIRSFVDDLRKRNHE